MLSGKAMPSVGPELLGVWGRRRFHAVLGPGGRSVLPSPAPTLTPPPAHSALSLQETLVSYMDSQESEVLPDLDTQFPKEIPLASCVAVWEAATRLKWDRQAR